MSQEFKSVPIQYHIVTTSDWTNFQILEGGFWSDVKSECLKGEDRLTQGVVYSDRRVEIRKRQFDKHLVEVRVTCKLNIYKDYLSSNIRYLVEKGNMGLTRVRVLHKEMEVDRMENRGTVPNNPKNPRTFDVPVNKTPPAEPVNTFMMSLKVVGLIGFGYLGILLASLFYCLFLNLDFVEFARLNPYVFIVGGAIFSGTFIAVASKRNLI
jgi:hypothetical protein